MKKFKNTPNIAHNCNGNIIWESRSVAVNCLVIFYFNKTFYILSEKRGSGSPDNVGKWCFPCGYLDYDETASEAAIREVYEESGLDLDNYINTEKMLLNNLDKPWYVDSIPSDKKQNVTLRFACLIKDRYFPKLTDDFSENNEIDELRWIKFENIEQYEWAFGHNHIIYEFMDKHNLI